MIKAEHTKFKAIRKSGKIINYEKMNGIIATTLLSRKIIV